jgi:SAM-dependent methyltransferase
MRGLLERARRVIRERVLRRAEKLDEPRMHTSGWNEYAERWRPTDFRTLPGQSARFVGDEWTLADPSWSRNPYGLSADVLLRFGEYLGEELLDRYLPEPCREGLEIGPGGGRLTALLAPRTPVLHLADASEKMLARLKERLGARPGLRFYQTDGLTLPALAPASLDYVIAFDVFVHFEPRLVFWYLRQIQRLLRAGGAGIIHYANVLTPSGWGMFADSLDRNVKGRTSFGAFGTMCPEMMGAFLRALHLEIVSTDTRTIPRDAVAVFRKPTAGA